MILGTDLTPVSRLSSAFMTPKSPYHVQFAYYESSLVVEYIVQKYGFASLRQILTDLGNGVPINDAIAKNTEKMDKFEKDFAAFARDRAENLAPGLDWTRPETAADGGNDLPGTNSPDLDVIKQLLHRRVEAAATNNLAAANNKPGTNAVTSAKPTIGNWSRRRGRT